MCQKEVAANNSSSPTVAVAARAHGASAAQPHWVNNAIVFVVFVAAVFFAPTLIHYFLNTTPRAEAESTPTRDRSGPLGKVSDVKYTSVKGDGKASYFIHGTIKNVGTEDFTCYVGDFLLIGTTSVEPDVEHSGCGVQTLAPGTATTFTLVFIYTADGSVSSLRVDQAYKDYITIPFAEMKHVDDVQAFQN
jgi:hypothetical protein